MDYALINTIAACTVTAFVFGLIAKTLRLPAIFGYLLAGVILGPYTPGFVADVSLAKQLAEIGIILLMFGVGLHFSLRDLMAVRSVAIPGAILQMLLATIAGAIAAVMLGFNLVQGVIFGFSLSVASTIVLLRSLEQRNLIDTQGGKIAVGWLVIEDLAMVLALVLLPILADFGRSDQPMDLLFIAKEMLLVSLKIGFFFVFMMVVGRRFLPWLLKVIATCYSSELSILGTLSIAMGFACMAYFVFDASLALGAFLAGMVLNESAIGRKSAENSLPMRDAFSVLFFVSVGMLFDPKTLLIQPGGVAATVFIIVVLKTVSTIVMMHLMKQSKNSCYTVAFGLAQIGEFSFIFGSLALSEQLIGNDMYNLILAGAMLSIVINPFLFRFWGRTPASKIAV